MLHPIKMEDFAALRNPDNYASIYYNRRDHPRTNDDKPEITKLVQSVPQLLSAGADFQEYILSWDTLYHNTWELYHAMIGEVSSADGAEVQKRRINALRFLSEHRFLKTCDIHYAIFSSLAPWKPHPPKPVESESPPSSSGTSNFVSKFFSRLKKQKDTKPAQAPAVEDAPAEPESSKSSSSLPPKFNAPLPNLKKIIDIKFFPLDSIVGFNDKATGGIAWVTEKYPPPQFKIPALLWQLNDTAMGATRLLNQDVFCQKFFPSYRSGDSSHFWVMYANHKSNHRAGDDDGKMDMWLGEDFVCVFDAASGRSLGIHMIDHY
jgi:hypothetical protein